MTEMHTGKKLSCQCPLRLNADSVTIVDLRGRIEQRPRDWPRCTFSFAAFRLSNGLRLLASGVRRKATGRGHVVAALELPGGSYGVGAFLG